MPSDAIVPRLKNIVLGGDAHSKATETYKQHIQTTWRTVHCNVVGSVSGWYAVQYSTHVYILKYVSNVFICVLVYANIKKIRNGQPSAPGMDLSLAPSLSEQGPVM